ncbi:MAG: hypothetical protein KGZ40_00695 [Clostridiales bacterium]|nr:hypothetical protein [Clostridiales bacterium]
MKNDRATHTSIRLLSIALAATLLVGAAAPATASVLTESRALAAAAPAFSSQLAPASPVPAAQLAKAIVRTTSDQASAAVTTPAPVAKAQAQLPRPVAAPSVRVVRTASNASAASAPAATSAAVSSASPSATAPRSSDISQARAILARYIATYPILQGTTIAFGDTRGNPQAIAYFKSGRIIVNPNHTVSFERIINHEIWHIIDWRDNGRIDWGENVPPSNANDFRG